MKLNLTHILFQTGENDITVDNINCQLLNPVYNRVSVGKQTLKSESFTSDSKVSLPNKMTSNTLPLIKLAQAEQNKGYVQVGYTFEDGEGIVWIHSFNNDMEPADGILDNFVLDFNVYNQE